MVDYSMSFLSLSTWDFFAGQVGGTILNPSYSLTFYVATKMATKQKPKQKRQKKVEETRSSPDTSTSSNNERPESIDSSDVCEITDDSDDDEETDEEISCNGVWVWYGIFHVDDTLNPSQEKKYS